MLTETFDNNILVTVEIKMYWDKKKWVTLYFCHDAHTREEPGTRRRGYNSKLTAFNVSKQGRARQGNADKDRNTGE